MLGAVGFVIVLLLNLFGKYTLNQEAAEFFSDKWLSTWFPVYTVWVVFLVVGAGNSFKKNGSSQN